MLLLAWLVMLVCLMYCLNCCRLSSTACRSSSLPLAAPLVQPSLGIDLSSSTQERSLARLPRTCWRFTEERDNAGDKDQRRTEGDRRGRRDGNKRCKNESPLSYHKWQETFLLPADGVQTEQRYPTGSIQTTGQGQEVIQSVTEHLRDLWPPGRQWFHNQDPRWLTQKRGGPVNHFTRVNGWCRPFSVVCRHLEGIMWKKITTKVVSER